MATGWGVDPKKDRLRKHLVRLGNATYSLQQREAYELARALQAKYLRQIATDYGLASMLTGILLDRRPAAASNAAYALGRMALDCPAAKESIRESGAIPLICKLLESPHAHPRYRAMAALYRLAQDCPDNAVVMRVAGAVPLLLTNVAEGAWKTRAKAAQAAGAMAAADPESRELFLDGGIMTAMKQQLHRCPIRWVQGIAKDVITDLGLDWDGSDAEESSDDEDSDEEEDGDGAGAGARAGAGVDLSAAGIAWGDSSSEDEEEGAAGAGRGRTAATLPFIAGLTETDAAADELAVESWWEASNPFTFG